jgi:Leucine-rich repeat (LRR) protein
MSETMGNQNFIKTIPIRCRYIIAAALLLLITGAMVFIWLTQEEQKPDPASEKVIREESITSLYHNRYNLTDDELTRIKHFSVSDSKIIEKIMNPIKPFDLTENDFSKVTILIIGQRELSDIRLLEKYLNLQDLIIYDAHYPKSAIPKWMKILAKLGVYNLNDRFALDLSPLKKLYNLQTLEIINTPVKNCDSLSSLKNLRKLVVAYNQFSDLEPIKELQNLQKLYITKTNVSNLEPLKGLTNLHVLRADDCKNITDEQVEDLQKALPELEIQR